MDMAGEEMVVGGMFMPQQTVGSVLCCMCGVSMQPNAANMCVRCLRSQSDITEGLEKHVILHYCTECNCYLQPPKTWIRASLESKELLTICIKRLKKLSRLRLVHAEFVWTEPHSKRIKVKLRVQKEVLNGAILEQSYIVEYVQVDKMCESCSRAQANPDQWSAVVQLRQHVPHRRTFFYLEQVILKHDAAARSIKITQMDRGIDFFFGHRSHASNFKDFLGQVVPIRSRDDKQLVSHDTKSNNYNYKHTFSVEICPICREDLICLPHKVSARLGNIGPLVLCTKVSNRLLLLDPVSLRTAYMDAEQYWWSPFKSLLSCRQLVEYIVLDIEASGSAITIEGTKYSLAEAQVARVSDFGKNDLIFNVRTHLGHLLNPGDYALGYDLYGANSNDFELDNYRNLFIPDVLLVKKSYEEQRKGRRMKLRAWKLKSMDMEVEETAARNRAEKDKRDMEYEAFLRDLEENPELRFNISLYQNKEYQPSETVSTVGADDIPSVPLEELLADLELSDDEEGGSGSGANEMME
ncbi:hypothetical protein QJS10_CPA03g02577 [Acorus calamus]|uniref:60S ribosomal export protein NMD3 n=1 Tax=Acorus calamus TaxID=4465 RepID=A0AAV9F7Z5_ACOCL|nr:hypothetical protein QJS10_CPA03g02577 [Acorus calamus]